MGTFNAGAIEAKLTLDRSAFTRELTEARAQAKKFQEDKIKPEIVLKGKEKLDALAAQLKRLDGTSIDIRADLSGTLKEDLKVIEAQIKKMDMKSIDLGIDIDGIDDLAALEALINEMDPSTIELDLDVDKAIEKLGILEEMIAMLDGRNIDLGLEIDGESKLVALAAAVEALDGRDIDLNVDVNEKPPGVAGMTSHFNRFQAIVGAVLLLLPLVPPVAATATAAVMGLASGFIAAGGALGVIGLGVAPTLMNMKALTEEISKQETRLAGLDKGSKEYNKTADKIANMQKELATQYGAASEGLNHLKGTWGGFQKAIRPEANELIGAMFRTLGDILPRITPMFNTLAPILTDVFKSIGKFVYSDEGTRMLDFFTEFGGSSLKQILSIGGNLLQFLGRLFEAFAPFGTTFLGAIEDVTQAWADWADGIGQTQGFQDFIAYVMEDGPKVWDLIKNLVGAFINLGIALAPLGSVALDGFNAVFGWIATVDPTILGALAIGLGGLVTGFLVLTAVVAIFNAVMAANPIALVVIAVAALVGALIYLWNTNEGFKNAVIAAWNAIVGAVQVAIGWFQTSVVPVVQAVWDAIVQGAQALWAQIGPIIMGIVEIITLGWTLIWTITKPLVEIIGRWVAFTFKNMAAIVTAVLQVMWSIISNVFRIIASVIMGTMRVIAAMFMASWNTMRTIVMTAIAVITNIIRAFIALFRGDISGFFAFMKNAFSAGFNGAKNIVTTHFTGIKNVIGTMARAALSIIQTVFTSMVSTVTRTMTSALGAVSRILGNIRGLFGGAGGWLIGAGQSIIQGLINGINNMAGRVKQAVSNVLSAARRLLPFSPAKEGPFSGRGWTLYSGQSISEGLAKGITDKATLVRDATARMVQGAVPDLDLSPRLAGVPVGGDGRISLSSAVPAKYMTVNVHNYNPVAEKSSVTTVREVTRIGQLGVFDG